MILRKFAQLRLVVLTISMLLIQFVAKSQLTSPNSIIFLENTVNSAFEPIFPIANSSYANSGTPNFTGKTLAIIYVNQSGTAIAGVSTDQLGVKNVGTATGEVNVVLGSPNTVKVGSTTVATYPSSLTNSGVSGENLLITWVGSPTLAQVNAVLNQIGYQTTSDNPNPARYIKITILDGSNTITFNKLLTVTAENDAPRAGASTVRSDITAPSDPIIIWPAGSTTPGSEGVANAIDNNSNTKYLNWGSGSAAPPNSGFVVTPASGATIVTKLTFVSANDESSRDPITYKLEGSRDGGGSYTTIVNSANTNVSTSRFTSSESAEFSNQEWYSSYRLTFPQLRSAGAMMQIGEVELLGVPFQRVVYTIGSSSPVFIHNLLSVTDVDNSDQIQSATVNITTNFNANDVLTWTNQTGITGSYNASTGLLSFTGSAAPSVYQTLLRSVKFNTAAPNSAGKQRLITFQVVDAAGLTSNLAEARVVVTFPPTLTSVTSLGTANRSVANSITYAMLSSASQDFTDADTEDVPLKFKIKSIGTNGTLTKGGVAVSIGDVVATGESLVWTPSTTASNVVVMSVRAFDGDLESSTNVNVTMNVQNLPAPIITSFTPTTAGTGETVVITGSNFSGSTVVRFGNVNATSFIVNSNTQITAVVGAAASGDVYVQNPTGNDTESGFLYKVVELKFDGNTLDNTDANRDATIVGTATYGSGASGQAICFTNNNVVNGTTVQNYLTLPSDLIRGRGSNFTVSLRFKTNSYGGILGYQNGAVGASGSQWVPILYVQSDGKLNANLWQGSPLNAPLNVLSSIRVDDGNWHKVEFSAAPGSITVYIDGVLAGSSNGTTDHLSMTFNQLGAVKTTGVWTGDPIDGWFGFNGCIDEFIIIDRSLTATQIQQVTQLPLPTITSFSPTTAKSGEIITITGTNLGSASSVRIGGVEARRFTVVSATEIRAIVGKDATLTTDVQLTTAAGTITATTFTFDCTNNSLNFDGLNDFVQAGAPLPLTSSGNFTIEAWVRPSLIDANYRGFFGKQGSLGRAPSIWVGPNGSLHTDAYNASNINDRYDLLVNNFFEVNTWVHVAYVRNGNTFIVYKNGVQVASRTAPASVFLPNENFDIGRVDNNFNGNLDEVRVWNTARTAQQIQTNIGQELVGNESGLAAYYNFNQGTAGGTNTGITTLNNLTATANMSGTLTNIDRSGTASNFVKGVWPVIITQPTATTTACSGVNVSLTVSAVGPQLSYQWYTNNSASNTGGTAITGATSATYTYTTTTLESNYFYAVVTGACSQTVTSTVSTVDVNATNWTKIYETTNPSRNASGEMVYTAGFGKTGGAASSHNGNFSRIKYRLENNVAGTLRWAEVSFDRLDNITLADLQIPDLVNNILIQKNVSNIEVTSNMPGVHTGKFSTGRLEFWNMDYRTFRSDLIPAGDASTYDWDDRVAGNSNGHGSFQIHNVSPQKEQTIFAWNMHLNGGTPEIGIGNAPSGNPDWTFNTSNGIGNFKVQISVQEAPVIAPNGVVPTCVGTPVTLTASAGASYLWSNGATTQSISTANAGSYTVTVTQANGCNSTSLPKTVTVNPLPSITYPNSSNSFERTKAITQIQPTVTGVAVSSYAISPALPTGLSFNTTTGAISGTPEVNSTARIYTVTASTASGCSSATTFTLEIFSAVAPSALSYAPASQTVRQGTAITAMVLSASGGVIASYSISPALPAGLIFNTTTGEISGTLTAAQTGATTHTITATNSGGSATTTVRLIYNTAPTDLSLNTTSVAENAVSGTNVGTLSATDADANDTFIYALVSGTGDTDNASFTIDGATLKTAIVFDFETKSSYSVRVRVTDAGGLSFEKELAISITNVNEAPTNITASASSVLENAALGTNVASFSTTDADANDTFTYTLVTGTGSTDNASFTIVGNSIRTATLFDFETKSSYSVRVRVTDAGGLSFERAFTITVTDVNEAPTLTAISDRRVYNVATSQIVNLAGITAGPETAQTTTTSVSTSNPSVFSAINVVGTQIQFTLAAGIATPQDVVVTVRVRDNGGVANGGVDTLVRTFRLGIDPMPVATASPNLITLGATAQLSATGANAVNYTWVAVGGSGILGSGASINVRPRGTTTYAVVVTNSFGYQATIPVLLTVIVDYKLVPNNLLTPNGDGVNDKWVIPNIDMYPDNEVMVYDKAGRAVFAKRGYNNEWDGTVNGKLLKEDAYFYVIKFNKDGALPIRGYVSIVR